MGQLTPEQKRELADWLEELEVPERFRAGIAEGLDRTEGAMSYIHELFGIFCWLFGGTLAVIYSYAYCINAKARHVANQSGASLYEANGGVGIFLLVAGFVALAYWRYRHFILHGKSPASDKARAKMFDPGDPSFRSLTRMMMRGPIRRAGESAVDFNDFCAALARRPARRAKIATLLLLAPAIVISALETNHFWFVGPSGLMYHRAYPLFSKQQFDFASPTQLVTGCVRGSSRATYRNRLVFILTFPTGDEFDLGAAKAASDRNKIEEIERINAALVSHIEHLRWRLLGPGLTGASCLNHWAEEFGTNGRQRLIRLLRLTPEEASLITVR